MSKQLLYYEFAVPVTAQRHGDWSLEAPTDYGFAGRSNAVPLATAEFSAAAMEYAIVFTGAEETAHPVVILGLKTDENLYLDEQGQWDAKYIPAFVRRYPFAFSRSEDGSRFTLCIDEKYISWNRDGSGRPLFDSDGEGTDYLNAMFRFVTNYQRQFDATRRFCRKLKELGLLESMTARFKLPSGQKAQLTGFLAIDREKLEALPGETLAELAKSGELELIYVHLQSMRNFATLVGRVKANEAGRHSAQEGMGHLRGDRPLH